MKYPHTASRKEPRITAGEAQLYVAVSGQQGQAREILIDTEAIWAWNEDKSQGLIDAQRLIDDLARHIRSAVQELMRP